MLKIKAIKEKINQKLPQSRALSVFLPALFFLLLTSSTILVIAIARKINQPVEYKSKATSETASDACRLIVRAGYCGGEASYCEGNSFYTPCQTTAGGRDIGQSNCPSTYHCCDPSVTVPTLTPAPVWPTCQQLMLNWQKTLENDPAVVSSGSSVKVSYQATFSFYAKGAIRPKGSPVSQNTHFDIQSGGSFIAPTTAGVYHVTLNIYDSPACKVFCSGGGIWYTTDSIAPDHCLASGIWIDQGLGCLGCQGWIKVE